jgi:hypothetical protein
MADLLARLRQTVTGSFPPLPFSGKRSREVFHSCLFQANVPGKFFTPAFFRQTFPGSFSLLPFSGKRSGKE